MSIAQKKKTGRYYLGKAEKILTGASFRKLKGQIQLIFTSPPFPYLQVILDNVEKLHCDMYDSALFPVALVNKLVSLSAHPSQRILTKFTKQTLS